MTPELKLYILEKEHPQVARAITTRLRELLPAKVFTDTGEVRNLLNTFCQVRGVPMEMLKGQGPKMQVSRCRREFGAVMLLCYQPEKLYGYTQKCVQHGLPQAIAKELNCSYGTAKVLLREVVVHYKVYQDFRNTVLNAHKTMLEPYL
ncbi:hypothetical protein Q4E40_02680 [Pontibacter sp. BT731]|uniref:hypothetical protein n=1 Tax=Pontibacter coccineus TaxID=3063328 RepID=UPI0026E372C0|nr:hypothetical protein [Pontibacter sp. BT731]MDO6389018.1 hypothetical protein [Pontibacter sp. BT731]